MLVEVLKDQFTDLVQSEASSTRLASGRIAQTSLEVELVGDGGCRVQTITAVIPWVRSGTRGDGRLFISTICSSRGLASAP